MIYKPKWFYSLLFLWKEYWWLGSKDSACQCRRQELDPRVGKISWRRKWQPTPVFLPGKSHGQRSVAGYSLWGRKRFGHDLATEEQRSYEGKTDLLLYQETKKGRKLGSSVLKEAYLHTNTFRLYQKTNSIHTEYKFLPTDFPQYP